jgi:uncharacterized membrane protein
MESPFVHAAGLLRIVGLFLSGICHQLPEHSLFLAGVPMPLCARCTGTYLGALLGISYVCLRGRCRASRLPPRRVLAVLGLFVAFWAIDGLNSYWQFVTGRVLLYVPNNGLRLATGLGQGLALSMVVLPLFNAALWQGADPRYPVATLKELSGMVLQLAVLAVLLLTAAGVLLYPILLLDLLSVSLLLGIVNTMIVILVLRRENRAQNWRQVLFPLSLGLALAIGEVSAIAVLRAMLWNVVL